MFILIITYYILFTYLDPVGYQVNDVILSYQMSALLLGCFAEWPRTPSEGSTVNPYVLGSSLDVTT